MPMRVRRHLFEFEDLAWCPGWIRRGITDLLHHQLTRYGLYRPIAPRLARLMQETGQHELLDLCSGSAGPVVTLLPALAAAAGRPVRVTLSDRFPNLEAFQALAAAHPNLSYRADAVDATAVPPGLPGVRTVFTAFHHFPPPLARAILADAIRTGQPLAVFEFTERTWVNAAKSLALGPLLVMLDTPFMRPVRLWRLLLTFVVPLIPLAYAWDAFASHMRTYSPEELRGLLEGQESPGYAWEVGQTQERVLGYRITYLIGKPVATTAPAITPRQADPASPAGASAT
jgi:hypothetical protein